MRKLIGLAVVVLALSSAAYAQAPDGMPQEDFAALERSLNDVLNLKENVERPWRAPSGAAGMIASRPAFSRGDRIACRGTACNDQCRSYEYTYTHPRMDGQSEFTGLRCFTNGAWRTEQVERNTGGVFPIMLRDPGPPPPDPAVVARVQDIQRLMEELAYYDGPIDGDFGPGSQSAARAFVTDAQSRLDPSDPSAALLSALRAVQERSNRTRACSVNTSEPISSCGAP